MITLIVLHGAKTCFWPKLHQDLDEKTSKGTMRGIPIGQMDKDGSKTRRGQKQTQVNEDESNEACVLLVAKNHVKELAQRLYQDLNNNVYTEEDKALIEELRILLDLKELALDVRNRGVPLIAVLKGEKFTNCKTYCPSFGNDS